MHRPSVVPHGLRASFPCPQQLILRTSLAVSLLALAPSGCGGGGSLNPGTPPSTSGQFVEFDAPAAATAAYLGTRPQDINDSGDIAGYFIDAGNTDHGFLRRADGTIVTFDAPGAGSALREGTLAVAINSSDAIVGSVIDGQGLSHGFLRDASGAVTIIDPPGSMTSLASDINDSGTVCGEYVDQQQVIHAFLRTPDGAITSFDGTFGPFGYEPYDAPEPTHINAGGEIVGHYQGFGFERMPDGTFSTFPDVTDPYPTGINGSGMIVGGANVVQETMDTPTPPGAQSFVGQLSGFSVFDPPVQGILGSGAEGINDQGEIAGTYADGTLVQHGYIRKPDGSFLTFDEPHASQTARRGTSVAGINGSGEVIGSYDDAAGTAHGYIRR